MLRRPGGAGEKIHCLLPVDIAGYGAQQGTCALSSRCSASTLSHFSQGALKEPTLIS